MLPRKLVFRVTLRRADVDRGEQNDCVSCPFARAILRTFRQTGYKALYINTWTTYTIVRVKERGKNIETDFKIEHPKKVQDWIHEFDTGVKGKLITFQVRAVNQDGLTSSFVLPQ